MHKFVLAAVAAAFLATPAVASETLTSTVISVDVKRNTLTLSDKTIMIVAKDVDLTAIKPGMKVAISAAGDEDGFSPATAVRPVE